MNWLDELIDISLEHSESTFKSHLDSTGNLLKAWGANQELIKAGKYHAIYSTSSFQKIVAEINDRKKVIEVLGQKAERYIFLYCFGERKWLQEYGLRLKDTKPLSKNLIESFVLPLRQQLGYELCSVEDILAICSITLANIIEQAPRLPLEYQDDDYIIHLSSLCRQILPNLPECEKLKDFSKTQIKKEILELECLFQWQGYKFQSTVIDEFKLECRKKFDRLLLRSTESVESLVPLNYIFDHLPENIKEKIFDSPKITNITFNQNKVSTYGKLEKWFLNQGVVAGLLPNTFAYNEITLDDQYLLDNSSCTTMTLPIISNSIIIDFSSWYSHVWHANLSNEIHSPNADLRFKIFNRIKDAFELIKETNTNTYNFILDSIRIISIRSDYTSKFSSSSWPKYIGLIGLLNLEQRDLGRERIVSAIIHESIHNFLYRIERKHPFTIDTDRIFNLNINSLWTGRKIPLPSFVHACFVWFGLASFWKYYINQKGESSSSLDEYIRSIKGFLDPNYAVEINRLKTCVRMDVLSLLDSFAKIIKCYNI